MLSLSRNSLFGFIAVDKASCQAENPIKLINFSFPLDCRLSLSALQNIRSEITFFRRHTICVRLTDPFAFSLNGTISVRGYSAFASLPPPERNRALLLPKKESDEDALGGHLEGGRCSAGEQLSFDEDDRDHLSPEEYLSLSTRLGGHEARDNANGAVPRNSNETCLQSGLDASASNAAKKSCCAELAFLALLCLVGSPLCKSWFERSSGGRDEIGANSDSKYFPICHLQVCDSASVDLRRGALHR